MTRREFFSVTGKTMVGLGLVHGTLPGIAWGAASQPDMKTITTAINTLGLQLLPKTGSATENALLSPFSIQAAFAMTWAGADGVTRAEMAKVLHYPSDEAELQDSYTALQQSLNDLTARSKRNAEQLKSAGTDQDPIQLAIANRLFGQEGYAFRPDFLRTTREVYSAPLEQMDFQGNPARERRKINTWVEDQTQERIQELVPPDGITPDTRLVLVNAIFFKAPWAHPFTASQTKPAPFHLAGGQTKEVPTMRQKERFGYVRRDGYTGVTIPYAGRDLQLLVLMPDENQTLAAFEKTVTPDLLAGTANAPAREIMLFLPRFKLQPGVLRLSKALQELGMKTAFDIPRRSANFDRMAPRQGDDYLFISEAFHKTFMDLDEKGTEAAAATAVVMMRATSAVGPKPDPIEVRIDRPFLFAIQHRPSGACLFLGRLQNPE